MPLDPVRNLCKVTVSTGYDNASTSIVLNTGDGAKLPDPSTEGGYNLVWYNATDYVDPSDDPNAEEVRVTAKSSDTITITRNAESNGAFSHNTAGKTYIMILAITKKSYDDISNILSSGWMPDINTWAYSSNDTTNNIGTINIPADMTSKLSKGMKVKYQQPQALTAYYTLDSNSNDVINSLNGTDTNITYSAGKFTNAAVFNGTTSKIVISDNSLLKPTGEFTLGLWFKTSTTGATQFVFQSYSQNTNVAGIYIFIDSNNVLEFLTGKNTGTTNGKDYNTLVGSTNVCDGNWHYVICTYRNNYGQVYLDGNLEVSGYMVAPVYAATNYVRMGCQNVSGTDIHFYTGSIDDVFLINGYALDEKTIRDKYNTTTVQGSSNITVTKNAIITNVGIYSGGNTPLKIYGGTDYSLSNDTISSPYYSTDEVPQGFIDNPIKWDMNSVQNYSTEVTTSSTTYTSTGVQTSITVSVPSKVIISAAFNFAYTTGFTNYGIYIRVYETSTGIAVGNEMFSDNAQQHWFPGSIVGVFNAPKPGTYIFQMQFKSVDGSATSHIRDQSIVALII